MAKRGRPTKEEAQKKALKAATRKDPWKGLTDQEILFKIHDRFDVMERITHGAIDTSVRGAIISGAPGVGKTYTVETALQAHYEAQMAEGRNFRYKMIKGSVTPVHLYLTLYEFSNKGNVVILDDTDSIFFEEQGIAILKAALDSTPTRLISWMSESSALGKGEDKIPTDFFFEGSMIFITNTDFQTIVDEGKSKLSPHLEALLSRSLYLDLKIHDRRGIQIWVDFLVRNRKILDAHYDITEEQKIQALEFMKENCYDFRTFSIRDAMKLFQLVQAEPDYWQKTAEILLLRDG